MREEAERDAGREREKQEETEIKRNGGEEEEGETSSRHSED